MHKITEIADEILPRDGGFFLTLTIPAGRRSLA
jgi:hypothetical protein